MGCKSSGLTLRRCAVNLHLSTERCSYKQQVMAHSEVVKWSKKIEEEEVALAAIDKGVAS